MSRVIQTSHDLKLVSNSGAVKVGDNRILDAGDLGNTVQEYNDYLASLVAGVDGYDTVNKDIAFDNNGEFVVVNQVTGDDVCIEKDVNNVLSLKDNCVTDAKLESQNLKDIAAVSATEGQVLLYSSGAWVAGSDQLNTYTAGNGLQESSNEFSIDSSVVPQLGEDNTFSGATNSFEDVQCKTANFKEQLAVSNDSQTSSNYWKNYECSTTDATPDVSASISLNSNTVYNIEGHVSVINDDGTKVAFAKVYCCCVKDGSSPSLKTAQNEWLYLPSELSGIDATFVLSGNNLQLQLTGKASNNLKFCSQLHVFVSPKY